MKIAFDYQIFCSQPYGGVSRYFVSTAQSMLAMGEDVRVFAPMYVNRYLGELPEAVVQGMLLKRYPPKTSRIFGVLNRSVAKWRIRNWRPDVVHETYFSRTGSAPKGVPTVLTVYDMIHELYPQMLPAGDRTSELKRQAVERADHIISISDSTRDDLIKLFGVAKEKVTTVHLATTPFVGEPGAQTAAAKGRPYLLYVGARGGYKNFAGFLSAVADAPRLKADFDVVAFGGPGFASAERTMIESLGFSHDQVRHVAGDDGVLGGLYAAAAAFVYPSLYEGFGLPPLEAMAQNCPVVSSNGGSMPEIIGDAGMLFSPSELGAMATAIETVVYSDETKKNLIAKGRERLTIFSWDKCAEQTLAVYRNVRGG